VHTADIPSHVRHCRLLREGGLSVYRGLVDGCFAALREEAVQAWTQAADATLSEDRADEHRGGMPARAFRTAHGGPVQDALYHASWLAPLLGELAGLRVTPTGERGTYNYYTRPGDFLALHRDIRRCDLTLIVGLVAHDPLATGGGTLRAYPEAWSLPIQTVRRDGSLATVDVGLGEGEALLLLGGVVPHTLRPIGSGQRRVVSIMCFRDLEGSG
jgi:hypothetical protein